MKCAHCEIDFKKDDTGFSSCTHGCDLYMCKKCSVCDKGHLLQWRKALPNKDAYLRFGMVCSSCRSKFSS